MTYRIIHTSDWHLGHSLRDQPREREHGAFLAWLLDQLDAKQANALLVAGDIFDVANPTAQAQRQLYDFLARARRRFPDLEIVLIGGNHDSASRLDAPDPLLRELRVHVVGGLPRGAGRALDLDRLVVPLSADRAGAVFAWVVAVPYLRASDLDAIDAEGVDGLIEGVRRVYAEALASARARRQPGQAIVAMGHAYMTGTALSELSERKILGGNQHALPVNIFPDDVAYVALGHLHLAQQVGRPNVRYSGSPIPLDIAEATYPHQVVLVELEGEAFVKHDALPIPRTVELLRIANGREPAPLADVLARVATLPARGEGPEERRPLLEVHALLDGPDPHARARVELACEGKEARLVHVNLANAGRRAGLADAPPVGATLSDPEQVIERLHRETYDSELPSDLREAFHDLLEAVHQARGDA